MEIYSENKFSTEFCAIFYVVVSGEILAYFCLETFDREIPGNSGN